MEHIDPGNCLGKKLLILGDVNTGKTTLCRNILEALCHLGLGSRIVILDLAPHIPEELSFKRGLPGIGGSLIPPENCGALYIRDPLDAPRLSSSSEDEAMQKARANSLVIEERFRLLDLKRRSILFLNDLTMYLQAGTAEDLIERVGQAETIVANGYWGERLGGGALTLRERAETDKVRRWFASAGTVLTLPSSASVSLLPEARSVSHKIP